MVEAHGHAHAHDHDHDHDHGLGLGALLLLLWAIIELGYARGRSDLVTANAYHDLFDVAFTGAVAYGSYSRELFPQLRHVLRCNLGPIIIILMTLAGLWFAVGEVTRPHGSESEGLWPVILLAVSAALSYNLMREGGRGSGALSNILTWHFATDVGGSSLGALVALVQIFREIDAAANAAAMLILGLACFIGLRIIKAAVPLIHLERNCQPAGLGE